MPRPRVSAIRTSSRLSCALLALGITLLALPNSGHAQAVDYAKLQDLFGEPITTSVTGKPQRASEAPAALVIITRDDIRRSPAHDIPGLLQAYAGIDVVRYTIGQADVSIRGGVQAYNPRLLVLVNGRQAYLDHYGMTNWAGLGVQLDEIQQIEVVKGPNSALFGFNAVSGVVNIITANPLNSQGLTVTGGAGDHGQLFASGVASVKLGSDVGLRVSGGYQSSGEFEDSHRLMFAPQAIPATSDPWHAEGSAEISARLGNRTDASLSVTHSYSQQLDMTPPLLAISTGYRFTSVGGHISHDTGWGVVSGRLFQNWSDIEAFGVPAIIFHNKVRMASADALVRAGSSNTVRLGIEYRSNTLAEKPGYPGATRYDILAASSMWESRLSDAVTFTVAGRIDHLKLQQEGAVNQPTLFTKSDFDRNITEWSFNGAFLVRADENDTVRIAGGRGVWLPSLFNFGARLSFPIPGLRLFNVIAGDPRIDPAKILSGEIGLIHTVGDSGTKLELTAFYNRTTDVIGAPGPQARPVATPPAYPFILTSFANVGTFEAYGIEASASGRFAPAWTWAVNYTWTHSHQDIAGNTANYFERPLSLDTDTPKHKAKAQVSYEKGPWLVSAAVRYTSGTRQLIATPSATNPSGFLALVPIKQNLALDAKLAFKISDKLTLAVSGENLTGANGAYFSPAGAERRIRASASVSF